MRKNIVCSMAMSRSASLPCPAACSSERQSIPGVWARGIDKITPNIPTYHLQRMQAFRMLTVFKTSPTVNDTP
jgi:hypothetical protein